MDKFRDGLMGMGRGRDGAVAVREVAVVDVARVGVAIAVLARLEG